MDSSSDSRKNLFLFSNYFLFLKLIENIEWYFIAICVYKKFC